MSAAGERKRLVLVGQSGSGKTSLIADLVKEFRRAGLKVEGVISQGVFDGDQKIAIEIADLGRGDSRLLAKLASESPSELNLGDWAFIQESIEWANRRLGMIREADVLILDELGPLEFDLNNGFQVGLKCMAEEKYQLGIMTVRPKCIGALEDLFPDIEVLWVNGQERETLLDQALRIAKIN